MKYSIQAIRVGVFFILGLVLIYAVFTVVGDRKFGEDRGYAIEAQFKDVRSLTEGTDVRMAGVRIGTVRRVSLQNGTGIVQLRIQPDIAIPSDSSATIAMSSLLGQNFLSIQYGSVDAPRLRDGERIQVLETADINDIMRQIGDLGERIGAVADSFAGFGGDDMDSLFANLNGLVTDNREQIGRIVDNLESITTQLSSGQGTLGKLINDDTAYNELVAMVEEIKAAATDARTMLADAGSILQDVRAGEGTVGKLLYDDSLANELAATIENIRSFSDKLNSGEGTLGKLVTDDSLYRELQAMLRKADQALDAVGDSGPLTAVGAAAGALF